MNKEILIANFKKEFPNLHRVFNNQEIPLSQTEYEETLDRWADEELKKEAARAEAETKRQAALDKLAALGLEPDDLKALGL